jgi:phage-related protein
MADDTPMVPVDWGSHPDVIMQLVEPIVHVFTASIASIEPSNGDVMASIATFVKAMMSMMYEVAETPIHGAHAILIMRTTIQHEMDELLTEYGHADMLADEIEWAQRLAGPGKDEGGE